MWKGQRGNVSGKKGVEVEVESVEGLADLRMECVRGRACVVWSYLGALFVFSWMNRPMEASRELFGGLIAIEEVVREDEERKREEEVPDLWWK